MKKIVAIITIISLITAVCFFITQIAYTVPENELESMSLQIVAEEHSISADEINIADTLAYKNTKSILCDAGRYRYSVVWRKSLFNAEFRKVSTHIFNHEESAFIAQDYISNTLLAINNGRLIYVSSEIRTEIINSLMIMIACIAGCTAGRIKRIGKL